MPHSPYQAIHNPKQALQDCESCINSWYSGPDTLVKVRPVCCAERGYNETMLLHGLNEFLNEIDRFSHVEDAHDQGATSD